MLLAGANHGRSGASLSHCGSQSRIANIKRFTVPARTAYLAGRSRCAQLCVRADAAQSSAPQANGSAPGKVLCIGEALFDLIADQKGVPREEVTSWTPHAGGAPCNVATACAQLGLDVTFVTALGDDPRGEQLLAVCKGRGVKLHAVQRPVGRPTRDVYVT
ncbi:hypothetical protein Agub_g13799, partial [Astrephomene gubernaculifera]